MSRWIRSLFTLAGCAVVAPSALAGTEYLMIPDSGTSPNRIRLFSAFDGSLINDNFIVAPVGGYPYSFGTPSEPIQVGNEIWITNQVGDSIQRFTATLNPQFIGTISGQLDNIRGHGKIGNFVYVSNDGGANGATQDSIAVYDLNGNRVDTFVVNPPVTSPFDVEEFNGDMLVPCSGTNAIHRFTTSGAFVSTFNAGDINFPQQVHVANTGPMGEQEVWAAGFSSPSGLYRYDASGTQIGYWGTPTSNLGNLRGCHALGDGQILVCRDSRVSKVNPVTGVVTEILVTSSSRLIGKFTPTDTPPTTNIFILSGTSTPAFALPEEMVTLTATVIPGTSPDSTGVVVTADLSAFGGSSSQAFVDQGGNVHTFNLTIPMGQTGGQYTIPLEIVDAQMRTNTRSISLVVINGFCEEEEPNSAKFDANDCGTIVSGGGVTGTSTGSSTTVATVASADNFLITTPPLAPGIYRHRMTILTAGTAGHSGSLRGLTQTGGIINGFTDSTLQSSATTTTPPRMNQWYGFTQGTQVYYRVTGTTNTTAPYFSVLDTTPVTPLELDEPLAPGDITISRGTGNTATIEMLVYDSNFEAIPDFNVDSATTMTRTFAVGTYYVAVSNVNTADHRPAGTGSGVVNQGVTDFPGVVMNSSTAAVANLAMRFQDSEGADIEVEASKSAAYEVVWIKMQVGTPSVPCPGDYNDDGVVDLGDLLDFLGDWNPNLGQSVTPGTNGDVNSDGVVDLADLLDFLAEWNPNLGSTCP
ncbi:MAG: hypothetical protein KF768_10765 [Phycisphaeraceae bacterium]|nr:hypothetical protein [Phycisphaeraceae bacterium]